MSANSQAQTDVLNQIQANFDRAEQELKALVRQIEQDPDVLNRPENVQRLNELNELVSTTFDRLQQALKEIG